MDNSRNNTYQKLADLHPLFSADAAARQIHGKGDIYGAEIYNLQRILRTLMERIEDLRARLRAQDIDPIEHCLGRIKDGESMREKLRLQGFPETTESALTNVYDAIGVRVVCAFLNDVYMVRDYILAADDIELIQEKDYIRHAKPNGYRSLHLDPAPDHLHGHLGRPGAPHEIQEKPHRQYGPAGQRAQALRR